MIISASREQAARARQEYATPQGARASVETYMGTNQMQLVAGAAQERPGSVDARTTYPMAYVVSQAPDSTVQAHYHQADQFQLFVGGSGRIGVHTLQPLTVHFAGANSPYGPLVAGSSGLQYVTLRRSWDPGAQWMPESAPQLRQMHARRHRALTSEVIGWDGPLPSAGGAVSVTSLLGDGSVGAWLIELGPEAQYASQTAADRFVLVQSGEVEATQSVLRSGACLFATAEETNVRLKAGRDGARIVLAQFDTPPSCGRRFESVTISAE